MATKITEKKRISAMNRSSTSLRVHDREAIRKILHETAGLWRGKKLDPLAYQRAMRRSYATIRKGK